MAHFLRRRIVWERDGKRVVRVRRVVVWRWRAVRRLCASKAFVRVVREGWVRVLEVRSFFMRVISRSWMMRRRNDRGGRVGVEAGRMISR